MTKTNVENFEEKAKQLLKTLKESFTQFENDILIPDKEVIPEEPVSGIEADVVPVESETIENIKENPVVVVPIEKAPKFRIYWRGWKEGNNTAGETESNLETSQMARAEAMSKLYDLGFDNIEILAIETINSEQNNSISQTSEV